jgi:RNase P subunit RPR2
LEKVKPITCRRCREVLCDRSGNTIVVGNLEVEVNRSRNIKCRSCGEVTRFAVDRNGVKQSR